MSNLTMRQHKVPMFYLNFWKQKNSSTLIAHDLTNEKSFLVNPINISVEQYYYEETLSKPNNRVEKILADMEANCSIVFNKLNELDLSEFNSGNEESGISMVREILTNENCNSLKEFLAYQYLRVSGAINQKEEELTLAPLSQKAKEIALNPGRFVTSGYEYIKDRFQNMKTMIYISNSQDFITSDWPCFDLKDSDFAPILGEEVGINGAVVVYMPITPRIGLILFSDAFSSKNNSLISPNLIIKSCNDSLVRNQNTLLIQRAERFVITRNSSSFIFKIAKKRKNQIKKNSLN